MICSGSSKQRLISIPMIQKITRKLALRLFYYKMRRLINRRSLHNKQENHELNIRLGI